MAQFSLQKVIFGARSEISVFLCKPLLSNKREMYTIFQCLSKTPNIYSQLFPCCNNCPYPSSPVSDYFDAVHVGPASCCFIPLQPSCSTRRWDSEDRPLGFLSLSQTTKRTPLMLLPYSCPQRSGPGSAPGSVTLLVQNLSASSGQQVLPLFFWSSPSNCFYVQTNHTVSFLQHRGEIRPL